HHGPAWVAHGPGVCLNQMPRCPTKPKSTFGGRHGNTKISPHWQTVPAAHREDRDLESAGRILVGQPAARENILRRGGRGAQVHVPVRLGGGGPRRSPRGGVPNPGAGRKCG